MKKTILILSLLFVFAGCKKEKETCEYNGKQLQKGSDGGCYYTNSNGNKTYVDRSNCSCL